MVIDGIFSMLKYTPPVADKRIKLTIDILPPHHHANDYSVTLKFCTNSESGQVMHL